MHFLRGTFLLLLLIGAPLPARAWQGALQARVEAQLEQAGRGARIGLVVATEDGRELIAINPDGRFIPASNTKLLTTAAAFATLQGLDRPDAAGGASVQLAQRHGGAPDVILKGHGDARLSSRPDCIANCLAALADAVAARTRRVGDIIGDDSLFRDERWSPGMSWNNIHTNSGTAISALTLDDNELELRVSPGAAGQQPRIALLPYFDVDNHAVTVAGGATSLSFSRLPGSRIVHLTGTIAAAAEPQLLRLGIDDPAHYAAWRFKTLLEARGVSVSGTVRARHKPPANPATSPGTSPSPAAEPPVLAGLTPPPLAQDIARINKASQNVHAELLLRRLGLAGGSGSIESGVAAVEAMLVRAGVPRTGWDISDGSGMSTYNRLAPRAVVTLLRWAAAQPWGGAWRGSLPVAGVDGTLANRFRGGLLERRLFAKTGSLNATSALSGYMIARSGRTLVFSFFVNDVPPGGSATRTIDKVLELIAAEH
jgi:D-alanyl-D-alanine carboxypeptidase/D-alanyl-D-alanine-endopeptidase (penicillin-binding protein 4)